jgi:hypothetical protein
VVRPDIPKDKSPTRRRCTGRLAQVAGNPVVLLTRASSSLSTTGVSPETAGQPGAQNPQLHGGPICPAQALISSNVSAQTFW